uniref:Uncharacterized protein n=1 Tax=Arundo donax TaxID=35708 RepID=A0A0A9FMC3_ARUDO
MPTWRKISQESLTSSHRYQHKSTNVACILRGRKIVLQHQYCQIAYL